MLALLSATHILLGTIVVDLKWILFVITNVWYCCSESIITLCWLNVHNNVMVLLCAVKSWCLNSCFQLVIYMVVRAVLTGWLLFCQKWYSAFNKLICCVEWYPSWLLFFTSLLITLWPGLRSITPWHCEQRRIVYVSFLTWLSDVKECGCWFCCGQDG